MEEFPEKRREAVVDIMKILLKIPNVVITKEAIILNGSPLSMSLEDFIRKILRNKTSSPTDVAASLYKAGRSESPQRFAASGFKQSFGSLLQRKGTEDDSDFESTLHRQGYIDPNSRYYTRRSKQRATRDRSPIERKRPSSKKKPSMKKRVPSPRRSDTSDNDSSDEQSSINEEEDGAKAASSSRRWAFW